MLLAAAWFALFAWPLLVSVRAPVAVDHKQAVGFLGAYRALWNEVKGEWRRDRNFVYYLVASAIFRDGLTGVFAFGAVLGVSVYGVSQADVLVFGVCASIVAAIGAVLGGLLDDRVGSKPVIVGSLSAMIAVGLALLTLSGVVAFWICGLLLCLFVGPVLASARALMLRMSADGKEGVAFGLYTTAGRAASFLAPLSVLHLHRPVRHRQGRDGRAVRGAGGRPGGDDDRRSGTPRGELVPTCRAAAYTGCAF